jgi:hypothetical protein
VDAVEGGVVGIVITTVADFEEETAWEKTVLSLATPLMPLSASGAVLDLRTKNITISLSEPVSEEAVAELRNSLLPLLVGAAWKVIDLGLELSFAMAGLTPRRGGHRWLIDEKSQLASAHSGILPGFSASSDLWQAIGSLYAGTQEIRHALVHRRVHVDPSTLDLIGFDTQDCKLLPLSYDEQMAFCRLSQRLAETIIEGTLSQRVEADLRGQLAVLQRHHGVVGLGSPAARPPVQMIDSLPPTQDVDVPYILGEAQRTFPGAQYVDIELYLADGGVLAGELESAPQAVVKIDLSALPNWLRFA